MPVTALVAPGPGGDQHDARLAGRARIALGRVDRALFVPHEDVADVVLLEDLVVDREYGAAGIAEDHLHALLLQGTHHHLRSGHRLGHLIRSVLRRPSLAHKKAPEGVSGGAWGQRRVSAYRPTRHCPTRFTRRVVIRGGPFLRIRYLRCLSPGVNHDAVRKVARRVRHSFRKLLCLSCRWTHSTIATPQRVQIRQGTRNGEPLRDDAKPPGRHVGAKRQEASPC